MDPGEPHAVPVPSSPQTDGLLDAVIAVSAGLELSEVLTRIVRSACTLVGARYGALGVLAPDRDHLMEFITHGLGEEERQRIGDPPRGHGVLGLLIRDPRPRRIADITSHPDSYGFPPNHPPMSSFLGAPIRVRDEVFGNLYLAVKEGAPEFSDEDQELVVALAAAAGVAIENARLYERTQVQRQWAQAVADVTQALLEGETETAALGVVADQVCRVAGARACAIALEREGLPPVVGVVHRRDSGAVEIPDERGDFGTLTGPHWEQVRDVRQPLLLIPGEQQAAVAEIVDDVVAITGVESSGPTALVPIVAGATPVGALLVCWESADQDVASGVLGPLQEFAQHVGLALVAASAQKDRAVVALLEDRERIARDMHDHVIQRLFATGLSLQASGRLAQHPMVRSRLEEAVGELDLAIKDIRQAIYQLTPLPAPTGLRGRLEELVGSYTDVLGFAARLELFGEAVGITPEQEQDVAAVVREGLANVARHAQATSATVRVSMGPSLEVVIVDDGVGAPATGRRSGLANLAERAAARGGQCAVSAAHPCGTRLTWSVPTGGGAAPAGRAARPGGPWSRA
ncbi:GAF domain-containing sensor histidine kinase [Pedococcus soli]